MVLVSKRYVFNESPTDGDHTTRPLHLHLLRQGEHLSASKWFGVDRNLCDLGLREAPGRRHLEVQGMPEDCCGRSVDRLHNSCCDCPEVRYASRYGGKLLIHTWFNIAPFVGCAS